MLIFVVLVLSLGLREVHDQEKYWWVSYMKDKDERLRGIQVWFKSKKMIGIQQCFKIWKLKEIRWLFKSEETKRDLMGDPIMLENQATKWYPKKSQGKNQTNKQNSMSWV